MQMMHNLVEGADKGGLVQQGVAKGVLLALWLAMAACPLLLTMAIAILAGWGWLGDEGLLQHWPRLLLAGGLIGGVAGCWLAERVRRNDGLLACYARLMNNPELNRHH